MNGYHTFITNETITPIIYTLVNVRLLNIWVEWICILANEKKKCSQSRNMFHHSAPPPQRKINKLIQLWFYFMEQPYDYMLQDEY